MTNQTLIEKIKSAPDTVSFNEVIDYIMSTYQYSPAQFYNGHNDDKVTNEAGTNEGSCKIFAFAQLAGLSEQETLNCFGDYYRHDVLQHPDNTDHANIRTFMRHGWSGIKFQSAALAAR